MKEIILIYPTSEGSQELMLEGSRFSFGRGSDADFRFPDDGLSRLNSTIYREGSSVWIVDENSTNGTFVNGERVGSGGTILEEGDTIKIGNYTELRVKFKQKQNQTGASPAKTDTSQITVNSAEKTRNPAVLIAAAAISVAFFLISISVVFIVMKSMSKETPPIVQNHSDDVDDDEGNDTPKKGNSNNDNGIVKTDDTPIPGNNSTPLPENIDTQTGNSDGSGNSTKNPLPSGKKYQDLSDAEKKKYIETKLKIIAGIIGNRASDEIPAAAVARIQRDVSAYANRLKISKRSGSGCILGDNLQVTFERASKNTWFISRSFMQEGIDPIVGIYVAMIESEHCPCVQSGTGPLGMFQFAYAAATEHFDKSDNLVRGASSSNGDDRCNSEKASRELPDTLNI